MLTAAAGGGMVAAVVVAVVVVVPAETVAAAWARPPPARWPRPPGSSPAALPSRVPKLGRRTARRARRRDLSVRIQVQVESFRLSGSTAGGPGARSRGRLSGPGRCPAKLYCGMTDSEPRPSDSDSARRTRRFGLGSIPSRRPELESLGRESNLT